MADSDDMEMGHLAEFEHLRVEFCVVCPLKTHSEATMESLDLVY